MTKRQAFFGGGSAAFGVWGLVHPASLGRVMGTSADAARLVGFRDTGVGLLIARSEGPLPFVLRALYDLGDCVTLRKQKPKVAAGALGFSLLAAAAAFSER